MSLRKIIPGILYLLLLITSTTTSLAQAGITWTSRTSAADNSWASVTFGNGLFVAVADNGVANSVMTSPDGITWTSRTAASTNSWNSITFGNGLFVAVAGNGTGNRVMTSPDGITWTSRNSAADNNWRSVTFGNGLFVAVASSSAGNRVMTSPDGITWTLRSSAADNTWLNVSYGDGLFVAVANNGSGSQVMTSSDGITWTSRSESATNSWQSVTWGNNLYVAVGLSAAIMTSPDGITWTSRTVPSGILGLRSVTYADGLFVVVTSSGTGDRVITSPDGITWTSRANPVNNFWKSVTYGNGMLVAVSNSGTGNRVMTSGPVTVPVTWQSLHGKLTPDNRVLITWQVSEYQVAGYEVEKSNDGIYYTSIAALQSKGDGENEYQFTQSLPITQTTYYRIRQTDFDKKFTYSNILVLKPASNQRVSIYPMPATHNVSISVPAALLGTHARLLDMQGRQLSVTILTHQTITINIASLPAGTYFLKIANEPPVKMVKQ